ncbi:MAG: hypothetical protein R3E97_08825 [Candidatus Eisenbacteria bacterium]
MRPLRDIGLAIGALFLAVPAWSMTTRDVFDLLEAGVGEDVILQQMAAESASFYLETDDILALRRAGATDHLLRTMIESGDTRRSEREAYEARRSREEDEGVRRYRESEDDYGSPGDDWSAGYYDVDRDLRVQFVYDPFGYYWCATPSYFVYYYPFRTWDIGFYYAGWHHWRWWGWGGYWPSYYRSYCDSYYWHNHHHTYYHQQQYGNDVRYRSRYDRVARDKGGEYGTHRVDGRDRVTRSRSSDVDRTRTSRGSEVDRTRTQPSTRSRDRSVDRQKENGRSRSEISPPRSTDRSRVRGRPESASSSPLAAVP